MSFFKLFFGRLCIFLAEIVILFGRLAEIVLLFGRNCDSFWPNGRSDLDVGEQKYLH